MPKLTNCLRGTEIASVCSHAEPPLGPASCGARALASLAALRRHRAVLARRLPRSSATGEFSVSTSSSRVCRRSKSRLLFVIPARRYPGGQTSR